jgi:hypothetical protein
VRDVWIRVRLIAIIVLADLGHKPSQDRLAFYRDIARLWIEAGGTRDGLIEHLKEITSETDES